MKSREVNISIETENDAFGENPEQEVARLLRATADTFEGGHYADTDLKDINGNTVGRVSILFEPPSTETDGIEETNAANAGDGGSAGEEASAAAPEEGDVTDETPADDAATQQEEVGQEEASEAAA